MTFIGWILVILQIMSLLGGGSTPALSGTYGFFFMVGRLLPGIIGVILLIIGYGRKAAP